MSLWFGLIALFLVAWVVVLAILFLSSRYAIRQKGRLGFFLVIGALTVIGSMSVYHGIGAKKELVLRDKLQAITTKIEEDPENASLYSRDLIEVLRAAVKETPDNPTYWFVLAQQESRAQNYRQAAEAFAQAQILVPDDITLLAERTKAEMYAAGLQVNEKIKGLISQVLDRDPHNGSVNGTLGIVAYRAQQYAEAVNFWSRALKGSSLSSQDAQLYQSGITQARALLAGRGQSAEPAVRASTVSQADDVNSDSLAIDVNVTLADGLDVPNNTILFVFIRQAGGPPMPVVVERTQVGVLPTTFRMDDSKVMIPGRSLADFPSVEVVARVSFTGQPTAQPGDYEATFGPVSPAELDGPISLVISKRVP